jgi:ATP-dependent Lon protease
MVNTCLQQGSEFGIVYFSGNEFQKKGCTAAIQKIIKRYHDGRMDIVAQGQSRFTLSEIYDDKPYLEAMVEFFDDRHEEKSSTETFQKLVNRAIELLRQINEMTGQYTDEHFAGPPDDKTISFIAAACDGFSYQEKQQFLEMTTTSERLRKAVNALEKLVKRLRITREIERIIGGNGNLPKSL